METGVLGHSRTAWDGANTEELVAGWRRAGLLEGAEANAWVALALRGKEWGANQGRLCAEQLAVLQGRDGRVIACSGAWNAAWTTGLAVLAWTGAGAHEAARLKAVDFIQRSGGRTWKRDKSGDIGHDSSLRGWAWTEGTSSWVEPTAWALLALEAAGFGDGPRAEEGRRMLLDRRIEGAGWNYGNTSVFGARLHPMPENSGLALEALAGRVGREEVEGAVAFVEGWYREGGLTPFTLAHAVLGLAAWGRRPEDADDRLAACAETFWNRIAGSPALWGRVALALRAKHGLKRWVSEGGGP